MNGNLTYSPDSDLWKDDFGNLFIKNEFVPEKPLWIDITSTVWNVSYGGVNNTVDWELLEKFPQFLAAFQEVACSKLKINSASYLGKIKQLVAALVPLLDRTWNDFSDISATELADIWEQLNPSCKIMLREFYTQMATLRIGGAKPDIAIEIKHWLARNNTQSLRDVLQWHETRGALTSAEEKVLREILSTSAIGYETDKEHGCRIFAWLLMDTLKRSSQVLRIRKNGVRRVDNKDNTEWFVEVEPVKYQSGLPTRWWKISNALAKEIESYSSRESVKALQNKYDRLIVWDVTGLHEHGIIGSADAKSALTHYIYRRNAISPRTGKRLHVTPVRIRHTGGTRLAFQGVSREIISEILEHDCPESAQSYIDAIGEEIVLKIDAAGRIMGNIFFELNKGYFQGRLVEEIDLPPVVIPEFSPSPIIVGSCGRDTIADGVCPKHPFLSCYDGCTCFFAWNTPDPHNKALRYFEKEISRWEAKIEDLEQKSKHHLVADKTLATYQRAASAAQEVLNRISTDN